MTVEMKDKNDKIHVLQKILDPNRIRILTFLSKGESCACDMVKNLSFKHSLLSHHLSVLQKHDFVSNRRDGKHSIYVIQNSKKACVQKILALVIDEDSDCNS